MAFCPTISGANKKSSISIKTLFDTAPSDSVARGFNAPCLATLPLLPVLYWHALMLFFFPSTNTTLKKYLFVSQITTFYCIFVPQTFFLFLFVLAWSGTKRHTFCQFPSALPLGCADSSQSRLWRVCKAVFALSVTFGVLSLSDGFMLVLPFLSFWGYFPPWKGETNLKSQNMTFCRSSLSVQL